jgi:hypothetical protein
VVSFPHCEHTAWVSTLVRTGREAGVPRTETLFALHPLQRFGSLRNCLSWKKSCSPAVKTKSAPQSMHFSVLSWNSIASSFAQRTAARAYGKLARMRASRPLECSYKPWVRPARTGKCTGYFKSPRTTMSAQLISAGRRQGHNFRLWPCFFIPALCVFSCVRVCALMLP